MIVVVRLVPTTRRRCRPERRVNHVARRSNELDVEKVQPAAFTCGRKVGLPAGMAPPLYSAKSKPYGSHRIRELYVFEVGHHQPPYVVGQGAGLVHNACVYLRLGYAVRDEDHGLRWGCCRCTSITCETRPADCMSAWPSGLEGPRLAGVGAAASTLCTKPLGLKYEVFGLI